MTITKALLEQMHFYEANNANFNSIRDLISLGSPLDEVHGTGKTFIEHLAVCRVAPVDGALERRLELIMMLLDEGVEIKFNVFGLADCAHVQILVLLLAHGADCWRSDELLRSLQAGNLDFADLLLRFSNQEISSFDLFELLQSVDDNVMEWLQANSTEIKIK